MAERRQDLDPIAATRRAWKEQTNPQHGQDLSPASAPDPAEVRRALADSCEPSSPDARVIRAAAEEWLREHGG